jgi:hypothetical protein
MIAAPATARPTEALINGWLAQARKDRPALAPKTAEDALFEYSFYRSGKTAAGSWRVVRGRDAVVKNDIDVTFARLAPIGWTEREMTVSADGSRVVV